MLHAVVFLCLLSRVPALEATGEIARDATQTSDAIAGTDGALIVDDPTIAAVLTRIYGVVDRAVADTRILHCLDELEDDGDILLRLAVELDIADMPTECDRMEGGFTTDLIVHTDLFAHVDVEGVHIVVEVIDPRDNAVALAVHTGEAPREAFGRSSKDGVVEVILLLVFAHHFVNTCTAS